MGRLRDLETLAERVTPSYTNVRILHRGTARYVDSTLSGTLRHGERRGSTITIAQPSNEMRLARAADQGQDYIYCDRLLSHMTIGSELWLGYRERFVVENYDSETGQVMLDRDLPASYPVKTEVGLYSVPVETIASYAKGVTTLQLRSTGPIVLGDVLSIRTDVDLQLSAQQYRVTRADHIQIIQDGRYDTEVDIDDGIPRALEAEESIQIRCYPAYRSADVRVPTLASGSSRLIGPFLVDAMNGQFFDGSPIKTTIGLQLVNQSGLPIDGYDTPVTVAKNHPVLNVPFGADAMLFWRLSEGRIDPLPNRVKLVCDQDGHFRTTERLFPKWSVPALQNGGVNTVRWTVPVYSNAVGSFRFRFYPNDWQQQIFFPGVSQLLPVQLSSDDQPAEFLEFVIVSDAGAEISVGSWDVVTERCAALRYTLHSTAVGNNSWQTTGLIVKPYFFSLDEIRLRYDVGGFNDGSVIL